MKGPCAGIPLVPPLELALTVLLCVASDWGRGVYGWAEKDIDYVVPGMLDTNSIDLFVGSYLTTTQVNVWQPCLLDMPQEMPERRLAGKGLLKGPRSASNPLDIKILSASEQKTSATDTQKPSRTQDTKAVDKNVEPVLEKESKSARRR